MTTSPGLVHASCVAFAAQGLLILGPAGSGKSSLALQLMALGCRLVSDDQTLVDVREGQLWARAPAAIRGLIEARGVGLLAADAVPMARLALAVDLAAAESERLPPARRWEFQNLAVPCLRRVESAHFAPAILQYLRGGRVG